MTPTPTRNTHVIHLNDTSLLSIRSDSPKLYAKTLAISAALKHGIDHRGGMRSVIHQPQPNPIAGSLNNSFDQGITEPQDGRDFAKRPLDQDPHAPLPTIHLFPMRTDAVPQYVATECYRNLGDRRRPHFALDRSHYDAPQRRIDNHISVTQLDSQVPASTAPATQVTLEIGARRNSFEFLPNVPSQQEHLSFSLASPRIESHERRIHNPPWRRRERQ
jgi:hypothetical protein